MVCLLLLFLGIVLTLKMICFMSEFLLCLNICFSLSFQFTVSGVTWKSFFSKFKVFNVPSVAQNCSVVQGFYKHFWQGGEGGQGKVGGGFICFPYNSYTNFQNIGRG